VANRRRQWQDFVITESIANAAQASEVLLDGDVDDTKGMTLVRMIIRLDLVAATPGLDNSDLQGVALGIGMISGEAIASAVFPEPGVGVDHPLTGWLWRTRHVVGENNQIVHAPKIDVDVRAKRKVMYGSPVLIINNDTLFGTAFTVEAIGIIRMLYLLE